MPEEKEFAPHAAQSLSLVDVGGTLTKVPAGQGLQPLHEAELALEEKLFAPQMVQFRSLLGVGGLLTNVPARQDLQPMHVLASVPLE